MVKTKQLKVNFMALMGCIFLRTWCHMNILTILLEYFSYISAEDKNVKCSSAMQWR